MLFFTGMACGAAGINRQICGFAEWIAYAQPSMATGLMAIYNAHIKLPVRSLIMRTTATTAKKATNITLSADVLSEAKSLGINISQVCNQFLRDLVRRERERRWQQENSEFIAAYNRTVADEGLPLDHWRSF